MINKVNSIVKSSTSFKAHFVNDENGNFNYLYNRNRKDLLNKEELDFFSRKVPNHDLEVVKIIEDTANDINGVGVLNHNTGEYKYFDTTDVPNTVILNNIIKKLNSIYKKDIQYRNNDNYEKIYSPQRGFFNTNSYYAQIHSKK